MNAILNNLRGIGRFEHAGHSTPAGETATGSTYQRDNVPGSYGRGSYAGHSTHTLDFSDQGSYGRGSYAGRSTADLDFGPQGSFASGA
jgi:hypothetical protein